MHESSLLPRSGGRVFLLEPESDDYAQFDAGLAGEFMRLGREAKKARDYEWVVHDLESVKRVKLGKGILRSVRACELLSLGRWYFDKIKKNLYIRLRTAEKSSYVIYIERE